MRFQSLTLATLTLALAAACGPRQPDCGSNGLVYVEGMGCVCPMGTRFVCDEGTTVCICEALDAGVVPSDGGADARVADAAIDGGCTGAGEMMCGDSCVDTRTSADHCGGCDDACGAPRTCIDGRCLDLPVDVEVSWHHTCVLRASGTVLCWGANGSRQLGDGTDIERRVPTLVVDVDEAVQLSLGSLDPLSRGQGGSSCVRRVDGSIVCWGYITSGDGYVAHESARPEPVPGVTDAVDISVGNAHACVVRAGGTVWCWGLDSSGQLGSGATAMWRPDPVAVPGVDDARSVSAGSAHTCVVRDDMTVWCWGAGADGQLGNGRASDSLVPVRAGTIDDAAEVSAGLRCTCARRIAGQVECWGSETFGCLGRMATMRTTSPFPITGPRDFQSLAESDDGQTCGRRADGTPVCWGPQTDLSAPRPDGGAATALPVARTEYTGAVDIAAALGFDCALYADGRVRCRGSNYFGQLGDGTTVTRRMDPVDVMGLP